MYNVFVYFKALVKNYFNRSIISLYKNNGGEYQALDKFLSINGISYLTIPPHILEHNAIFKWCHQHIIESGLSLFTHVALPFTYWNYDFSTSVYNFNHMPITTLKLSSPYDKLFGLSLDYFKLWVFVCLFKLMALSLCIS